MGLILIPSVDFVYGRPSASQSSSGYCLESFPTKIIYAFLVACTAHCSLFVVSTVIALDDSFDCDVPLSIMFLVL
jgi:hypothetical protein